jgi:hypothetical protein
MVAEFGMCKMCKENPRFSRRCGVCKTCRSQKVLERQRKLKAQGIDYNKRLNESAPHSQYPSKMNFMERCNHCGLAVTDAREFVKHKATHNDSPVMVEEWSSLTSSPQSWVN